jgi:hypothetical protein
LNQPHVQQALGVPVNYTNPGGNAPYYAFQNTGDYVRGGYLEDLAALIDSGVKVALVYGDRDYACNWIGGEAVSLAVNYTRTAEFAASGYANITTNSTYVGGLVRQYGNFSFSRVFQAGHEVPAYQPQTAYEIFRRSLFNLDIATGTQDTAGDASFQTQGLADTWSVKDKVHRGEEPFCYSYAPGATCWDEQLDALADGSALVQNYILIDNSSAILFPDLAKAAGFNGSTRGGNAANSGSNGTSNGGGSGSSNMGARAGESTGLLLLLSGMLTVAVVA